MKKILGYLKGMLGTMVLERVLKTMITEENVVKGKNWLIDTALDPIEDYCKEQKYAWAEKPLLIIRKTLNVPDNDDPVKP